MSDDLIPPSPTSLDMSSQRRSDSLRRRRDKILKSSQKRLQQPDPAPLAVSIPIKRKHSHTGQEDSQNPIFDDSSNDSVDRQDTAHKSIFDTFTPVATKRARFEQDPTIQNPRKINYDSDDLSQRHSPLDSDSSVPGSPTFFDLDDDDDDDIVKTQQPVARTCSQLDLSINSPIMQNLRQLGSQLRERSQGKAQEEIKEDEQSEDDHQPMDTSFIFGGKIPENAEMGFRTAANRTIDWKKDEKDTKEECNEDSEDPYQTVKSPSFVFGGEIPEGAEMGFRTAANKPIDFVPMGDYLDLFKESSDEEDVVEEVLQKDRIVEDVTSKSPEHPPADDLFDPFADSELNDDILNSVANESSQMRSHTKPPPTDIPKFSGFISAAGKPMYIPTEEDRRRAEQFEKDVEADVVKTINFYNEREPSQHISQSYLERLHAIDQKRLTQKPSSTIISTQATRFKQHQMSTPKPQISQMSLTQEVSAAVNAVIQDPEFFMSQIPVSPICQEAVLERKRKRQAMVNNPRRNMLRSKVTKEMEGKRKQLITSNGSEKPKELKRTFKSEFIKKKLGKEKVTLKSTFQPILSNQNINSDFIASLPDFEDLLHFQFNAMEFLTNDQILEYFTSGIPILHFRVPMTENFHVGALELENAFLASRGIDPELITHEWFNNALKLVLWKVISMELHLPDDLRGEILTLENVLNELHYRYYLEIDCSKRSILRECLEMDEAPGQLMALLVADVQGEDKVTLCDGHYSVRAKVDECLERQIAVGKLRRGIKLMVDSAELLNLTQGYAPFEVPASVALKIHGNSTRRCKWDTRLGRYYARRRLKVSLGSVDPKGGTISAMDLLVIRKYPLLYVTDNCHKNERMHRRYLKELETRNYNLFEKLYHKVDKEMTEQEAEDRRHRKVPEYNSIKDITDMDDLWHVLNSSNRSKFSEDQMTKSQRSRLDEFRENKAREKRDKIKARVDKIMEKDLNTPRSLLRIKVTDLKAPSLDHCGELWIWNLGEELDDMIKDGVAIHVEDVMAAGFKTNNIIKLNAGKRFFIRELQRKREASEEMPWKRQLTKISEITDIRTFAPIFQEFDCVVIILKVTKRVEQFQHVFATDDQGGLISLNFFSGLQLYACEDLVKPGQVIAFSNVQLRKKNDFNIPNGYISETTVLTSNPRRPELIEEMNKYKGYLEKHSLEEIMEEVLVNHPFLKALQSDSKSEVSRMDRSTFLASPLVKTPIRTRSSAAASSSSGTFVTPGRSALQTPLIERQINLLGNASAAAATVDSAVFQSPRTPVRSVFRNKRKLGLKTQQLL